MIKKRCFCCSGKLYTHCCKPYLIKDKLPPNPESLMRSRYTAFVLKNFKYIEETMREKALQTYQKHQGYQDSNEVEWVNLNIISSGLYSKTMQYVEFIATYRFDGLPFQLHEKSIFKHIEGVWYYTDGIINAS